MSGETHVYLNSQYRLKVQKGYPERVKLIGHFLFVRLEDRNDSEKISNLLEKWYRVHAQRVFNHRLIVCLKAACVLKLTVMPNIVVRKMKKRWRSCTKNELFFKYGTCESPRPLYRLCDGSRTLPPEDPSPRQRFLPTPDPLYARLGSQEETAGGDRILSIPLACA